MLRPVLLRHSAPAAAHWQADYATTVLFTAVGFGGNGAMLLPGLATTLSNFPEARCAAPHIRAQGPCGFVFPLSPSSCSPTGSRHGDGPHEIRLLPLRLALH